MSEPTWLVWARALQAIAQTGLHYGSAGFDRERYAEVQRIAAEMTAAGSGELPERLVGLFGGQTGYATPKVGVRGAVFRDDAILLVRERHDDRWSLPGGWADVNQTPAECVAREIMEESGFTARPVKLIAAWDRDRHSPVPYAFSVYVLFFLCELTGGAAMPGPETSAVAFFPEDGLPELSLPRVTAPQIRRMFAHRRNPDLPAEFD